MILSTCKKMMNLSLVAFSATIIIAGCGQKGDLYLANSKQNDKFLLQPSTGNDDTNTNSVNQVIEKNTQKMQNDPNDF